MARMPNNKDAPFQPKHALEYGLEVVMTNQEDKVQTVRCRFCAFEGRDRKAVGITTGQRKRACRQDVKYFCKPFLPFNFRKHLEGQHAKSWEYYQALSIEDKMSYFTGKTTKRVVNTLQNRQNIDTTTTTCDLIELVSNDDDEQVSPKNNPTMGTGSKRRRINSHPSLIDDNNATITTTLGSLPAAAAKQQLEETVRHHKELEKLEMERVQQNSWKGKSEEHDYKMKLIDDYHNLLKKGYNKKKIVRLFPAMKEIAKALESDDDE